MIRNHPILTYHKVDEAFEWGLTRVTPRSFRTQITYLLEAGYRLVTLSQLMKAGPEEQVVAITFDDAYRSVYRNAFPILNELGGHPAPIFVITDYVGRKNTWDVNVGGRKFDHATWDELAEMQDAGFEIGSHTLTHPNLTRLSEDACYPELAASKEILNRRLGAEVRYVSYPFGKFNSRIIALSKQIGYAGATIFYPVMKYRFNTQRQYLIRRYAVYLTDGLPIFKSKLKVTLLTPIETAKQNIFSICANATIFVTAFKEREKKLDTQEFIPYNVK